MKLKIYITLILIIVIVTIKGIASENSDGTNSFNSNISEKSEASLNLRNIAIIKELPLPVSLVLDITYDGENLWIAGYQENSIYKISPIDGSVIKTIPSNGNETPRGMTFAGSNLYIIDSDNRTISKVDTANGDIIYTFDAPCSSIDNAPAGLAWDGINLWQTENFAGINFYIYKMDTLGTVLSSLIQNDGASGLTFAYNSLWKLDNKNDLLIEVEMEGFTEVQEHPVPGGEYPNGLTFDGEYLWLANGDKNLLYQIDVNFTSTEGSPLNKKLSPISLTNTNNELALNFQPNQFKNSLSLEIYNSLGQLILNRKNIHNNFKVDLKSISKGTYFYKVLSQKKIVDIGKVIK